MTPKFSIIMNTFMQFGGRILSGLVSVVIVKLISSYLGVKGYGEYSSTYEFLSFFAIFADLGIFTIAVKNLAKAEDDREEQKRIFGNILGLRLVLTLFVMSIAIIALFIIPQYTVTRIPYAGLIASWITLGTMMTGSLTAALQVSLKMGRATMAFLLGKGCILIYMLAVVFHIYKDNSATGFYHLYYAGLFGGIITSLITAYYANKYIPVRFHFDLTYWKAIVKESAPYGVAVIFNQVYFRIGAVMLLILAGTHEVGIYAVPMRILEVLTVISFFFMNAMLPSLTKAHKAGEAEMNKVAQFGCNFMAIAGAPIIVGSFVLAYPIIFVISTPEFLSRLNEGFYGADYTFKILTIALVGAYFSALFTYILIAADKQKYVMKISGLGAIINVLLNLLLIPKLGARGVAIASVISELIIVTISAFVCYKSINLRLSIVPLLKVILSVTVMGLFLWLTRDPLYHFHGLENKNILILIPLGGIIYLLMLFGTGLLNKDIIRNLRSHG